MKPNHARRRTGGFTGWDLLICVVTLVLFVGVFVPYITRPRGKGSNRIGCVSNLKQIGLAFRMWSNDHGEKFPWEVSTKNGGTLELISSGDVLPHFQAISNELNTPKVLICSNDGQRVGNRRIAFDASGGAPAAQILDSANQISYFVGLDADQSMPQTILSGDRNVASPTVKPAKGVLSITTNDRVEWTKALHNQAGNIGLADGSASQATPQQLDKQFQAAIASTTQAVHRIALPE
jgi:hypothetical protein